MRPTTCVVSLVTLSLLHATSAPLAEATSTDDSYPLDSLPREVSPKGKMECPHVDLVRYHGDVVRYHKPVLVYVGFKERLTQFEEVVREVAMEVYGRPPKVIHHAGTYNCRRVSGYPVLLSEHGLGNGIDVVGFDFAPARRVAPGVPRSLRREFQVRLGKHWDATSGVAALHARFLRTLASRLVQKGIFRVLLGPAYPGHKGHFHLDCAPYRLVAI
ncbi:MAG: extensin family protein [Deltaproteobacteria bacterium]|nr:extensin family protein [Deltaproteobacteria bacterium]